MEEMTTSMKIRGLLASRGWTQTNLSEYLDCTRETISNRLRADNWSVKDLKRIAECFNEDVSRLL